tara:strand:- start:37 stop:342 length:306 start_codon:yes stop_codon:yes gene_type:complete
MNSTKSDYQNINLLVQSLTHAEDERDYTYVTIDGLKAFSLACPLCSPDSKRKTAKIFPKRIEDWKGDYPKRWFYLCKGESNCACKGLQSLDQFVSHYCGQK